LREGTLRASFRGVMLRVGIIGWRGMVGSVLMDRMREEKDFENITCTFFSTSNAGSAAPDVGQGTSKLVDAHSLEDLEKHDVLISCQGGDYTTDIYPKLRSRGYTGYWIDAASTLRMSDETVLILDPVNRSVIDDGLKRGVKTFAGPNCTVSLMLMALSGLFKAGHVEWLSSMTYQAASGAGANNMRELVAQMAAIGTLTAPLLADPASTALDIDRAITKAQRDGSLPSQYFKHPLAASLLPWIDKPVELGQSREEWKGFVETNKILGLSPPVPVDGVCVRVGSMRCHSQGFTIKLRRAISIEDVAGLIAESNPWVRLVDNTPEASLAELTPTAVSGKLTVPIGRLRKMRLGPEYVSAFSVGDQLLWGAAEPLRRMLRILQEK
jgi:aspartate-semialdehyde dehydrogenase